MASTVFIWFNSEIYFWRSLAATCWSVICLPFFLIFFLLLSEVSIMHPMQWLQGFGTDVVSSNFLITLGVFSVGLVTVTWFSLPYFSVTPAIESTILASVLGLLRWSRLPLLVVSSLAGAVCTWSMARMMGKDYQDLNLVVNTAEYERVVLNEGHLFLVLCGIFSGLCHYWRFFVHRQYYLIFPHIQRYKLSQLRSESWNLLYSSMWHSLHTTKYFYILYYLFGSLPKTWIYRSFSIEIDASVDALDSVMGMLNVSLYWHTYLVTLLLTLVWSLATTLLRIYHTEHLEFPVQSAINKNKNNTLPEALACSYSPLLQHLAFYDLSWLSKCSPSRRKEILSLSQPGGHPRIWTSISNTALGVVRDLSEQVKEENWAIMSRVTVGFQRTFTNGSGTYGTMGEISNSSFAYRGQDTNLSGDAVGSVQEEQKSPSLFTKARTAISNIPLLSHLVAESSDSNNRRLFASCQLQIWAVEGLSQLAAKSYTEDKYGVVQGLLPVLFALLLDLHEAIEKHLKLTTSTVRKPTGDVDDTADALLHSKLHAVNKAAIFRMTDTYRDHLQDLRLHPEHFRKLQPFIAYNI